MNPDEQRALVLAHLERRERIADETRRQLAEAERGGTDPLAAVDPEIRRDAEDEFYARQGRRRYVTSDGRTLFLTPDEIARRRTAARKRRQDHGGGLDPDVRRRQWLSWAFDAGVVLLALVLVWLILR